MNSNQLIDFALNFTTKLDNFIDYNPFWRATQKPLIWFGKIWGANVGYMPVIFILATVIITTLVVCCIKIRKNWVRRLCRTLAFLILFSAGGYFTFQSQYVASAMASMQREGKSLWNKPEKNDQQRVLYARTAAKPNTADYDIYSSVYKSVQNAKILTYLGQGTTGHYYFTDPKSSTVQDVSDFNISQGNQAAQLTKYYIGTIDNTYSKMMYFNQYFVPMKHSKLMLNQKIAKSKRVHPTDLKKDKKYKSANTQKLLKQKIQRKLDKKNKK